MQGIYLHNLVSIIQEVNSDLWEGCHERQCTASGYLLLYLSTAGPASRRNTSVEFTPADDIIRAIFPARGGIIEHLFDVAIGCLVVETNVLAIRVIELNGSQGRAV